MNNRRQIALVAVFAFSGHSIVSEAEKRARVFKGLVFDDETAKRS